MPLQQTSGNVTADAFGGGVALIPNYIESCFSTYLYTGNDTSGTTTQTITNDIDLSTKGGLVWVKWRSGLVGSGNHVLVDTARGVNKFISSNTTSAEATQDTVSAFNTTGFTLLGAGGGKTNYSGDLYASWTFRKQPKFFDVVTYTGTGSAGQVIPHNLGSAPGCIIVKATTGPASNWAVYHRSLNGGTTPQNYGLYLSTTDAEGEVTFWNNTAPTSTNFTIGNNTSVNRSGETYVAYIYAHNAGGFGLTGTDNVISCGSFVGSGSNEVTVNLGYEPQWILWKRTDGAGNWSLFDTMRGLTVNAGGGSPLFPNLSNAESVNATTINPTSTGFYASIGSGATFIYIAIRRGPMKVPTDGTKVFTPNPITGGVTTPRAITSASFAPDLFISKSRTLGGDGYTFDRLRGRGAGRLMTQGTAAEVPPATATDDVISFDMRGVTLGNPWAAVLNAGNDTYIEYFFGRAPGFFDEVCYTGTGVATTVAHNLGVVPEWTILKPRSSANGNWAVCFNPRATDFDRFFLDVDFASSATDYANGFSFGGQPTSTTITLGNDYFNSNRSGVTYVAYLFATCAGVSKVGSYTGTGATQTINCGFAAGARFVLIKRTDSTGDWYVWDSARGMVSGTDPSLLLNTTAAEVNANSVYAITTGFQIVSTAAGINASGGSYIFLAIA